MPSTWDNILITIGLIIGFVLLPFEKIPGTKDANTNTNSNSEDIISEPKTISWIYGLGALLLLVGVILRITHWIPNLWASLLCLVGYILMLITLMVDTSRKIRKK